MAVAFSLVAAGPIGLSEGHDQITVRSILAILAQKVVIGANDEVGHALVLAILMLDGHLVALDHDALEDGQSLLVVHHGLDQAIVRNGHHKDVAVVPGVAGSANRDLGRTSSFMDHGADAGIGANTVTAVMRADGAGLLLHGIAVALLQEVGGANHVSLIGLRRGPGAVPDDFLLNQVIVNEIESHR